MKLAAGLKNFHREESGQVTILMAAALICLLALGGFAVDVGRAYYTERQLQASADAAALAGAAQLPNSTAVPMAVKYSSVAGDSNARTSLQGTTMVPGYPLVECLNTLKTQGLLCSAPANGNAVEVKEELTIPMYFLTVIGKQTLTLSVTSTATSHGSQPTPYNVAIILDTTLSMLAYDQNCGNTQMQCALNGATVFLQTLSPCAADTTCTITNGQSAGSVDRVALFVFPTVTQSTMATNTNCTVPITSSSTYTGEGSNATNPPAWQTGNQSWGTWHYPNNLGFYYSMPPETAWGGNPTAQIYDDPSATATSYVPGNGGTYQVTSFLSDYRFSDNSPSLNANSQIVRAVGGASNCNGVAPPNFDGVYGTWYPGVLYAAQAALLAEQANNPGSSNVIIILGDGDNTAHQYNGNNPMIANSNGSGYYPSYVGSCGQSVAAAKAIAAAGTEIYTVAYGANLTGCQYDQNAGQYPNISPCGTMTQMASSTDHFFSDYNVSGANSGCYSAQSANDLNSIFAAIAAALSHGRLIPDNET
jgi:Flp pilus assembly protein TadG